MRVPLSGLFVEGRTADPRAATAQAASVLQSTAPDVVHAHNVGSDLLVPGAIDALLKALQSARDDLAYGRLLNQTMPDMKAHVRVPEYPLASPLTSSTILQRDVFDRFGPFADTTTTVGWRGSWP